jgi:hypothetical protein
MDVKGAKALSERLAEAARNVDLPSPSRAVDSGDTSDRASEVADTTAGAVKRRIVNGGDSASWQHRQ